ncbi:MULTISPECIES: transporter suffix domain-containing protein [Bacteroides]|jgi:hypothetical protein|uniref:transporter suffix domain-containing protein n=1 Tax=Bacteroides TaxID=816 RepID=UPI000469117B|nr:MULTISPECIES: transporter suffix domain-containing protein [Bacteroides]
MNIKKKTGLALLAFVVCCWGITPILPFLDFPNKAIIITTLLITNEVLFIITIALLGKEYWNKIKNGVSRFFLFRKKETNDQH